MDRFIIILVFCCPGRWERSRRSTTAIIIYVHVRYDEHYPDLGFHFRSGVGHTPFFGRYDGEFFRKRRSPPEQLTDMCRENPTTTIGLRSVRLGRLGNATCRASFRRKKGYGRLGICLPSSAPRGSTRFSIYSAVTVADARRLNDIVKAARKVRRGGVYTQRSLCFELLPMRKSCRSAR